MCPTFSQGGSALSAWGCSLQRYCGNFVKRNYPFPNPNISMCFHERIYTDFWQSAPSACIFPSYFTGTHARKGDSSCILFFNMLRNSTAFLRKKSALKLQQPFNSVYNSRRQPSSKHGRPSVVPRRCPHRKKLLRISLLRHFAGAKTWLNQKIQSEMKSHRYILNRSTFFIIGTCHKA